MKRKIGILNGKTRDEILWKVGLDLLLQGELMRFRAPGASMRPFIRDQDVVLIKPWKAEEVTFGDIILYERLDDRHQNVSSRNKLEGHKVIYRFLGRKKIGGQKVLITKGDANPSYDRLIQPEHVLGKVVGIEKKGWKIRLDTKIGRLLNIFLAIISPFSFLTYPLLGLVRKTSSSEFSFKGT